MRRFVVIAVSIAVVAAPSAGRAAACPADATKASLALWAGGSIPTGQTVSGTHPCGRKITCTGGTPNNLASRSCRWQ